MPSINTAITPAFSLTRAPKDARRRGAENEIEKYYPFFFLLYVRQLSQKEQSLV